MRVSADVAFAIFVEMRAPSRFRYFIRARRGRVTTAWSLAGAKLYLSKSEADGVAAGLEMAGRFARVVEVRVVNP